MAPVSRCTWSPVGQTPQIRNSMSRVRYSALAVVTVPQKGESSRFYFSVYPHNVRSEQVVLLLKHLLRLIPGHIVLVWDNAPTHRAKVVKDFIRDHKRLHIENLPPYAPELNPVENSWSQMKFHDLGNFTPYDPEELYRTIQVSAQSIRVRPKLCAAFLRGCSLTWKSKNHFL
jgi:transposase